MSTPLTESERATLPMLPVGWHWGKQTWSFDPGTHHMVAVNSRCPSEEVFCLDGDLRSTAPAAPAEVVLAAIRAEGLDPEHVELVELRANMRPVTIGKTTHQLQLVPTENRGIADTGDVEECCVACGEAIEGGHTAKECFEHAAGAESQVSDYLAGELEALQQAARKLVEARLEGFETASLRPTEELKKRELDAFLALRKLVKP